MELHGCYVKSLGWREDGGGQGIGARDEDRVWGAIEASQDVGAPVLRLVLGYREEEFDCNTYCYRTDKVFVPH